MEWTRVLQYLREGENLSTKFLAVVYNDQDIGPTLCGMVNTIGGKIFIGMDPHNFHLNGTTIDDHWVRQMIQSFFSPGFKVQIDVISKNDKRILCVHVPSGYEKPYFYRDTCFVMDNKHPRQASKEEVLEFKSGGGQAAEAPVLTVPGIFDHTEDLPLTESAPKRDNPFETAARSFDEKEAEVVMDVPPAVEKSAPASVKGLPTVELDSHHTKSTESELELDLAMITDELLDLETGDLEPATSANARPADRTQVSSTEEPEKEVVLKAPDFVQPENKVTYTPVSIQQKKEAQLNERQKKALYFLNTESFIKNKMYRELFDVSHKTAHLELVDMMGKGFIFQEGSGRSTCYKKL